MNENTAIGTQTLCLFKGLGVNRGEVLYNITGCAHVTNSSFFIFIIIIMIVMVLFYEKHFSNWYKLYL